MSFTAQDVKALREKTGVGMMECKKALVEADGDMDKAIDVLRERGLAASVKKSGRTAADGVVYAYTDEASKVSVLVEVNSETDFVAKNEKFQSFVADVAKTIAAENPADVEALEELKLAGSDRTVKETIQDLVLAIGENMKIRRFVRTEGIVSSYIHMGGDVGVLVNFDTTDELAASDEFKAMGKDVAMQIAAMSPSYLDPAAVPAEVLDHETEIQKAQMKEDPKMANKPVQVLANIVKGKRGKYYKENCLLNQ
ncbi:MAG: elongation factor Ts, partial [Clostridia bacterium]|nr:elongation factor Ts [Clostridia bacterium]